VLSDTEVSVALVTPVDVTPVEAVDWPLRRSVSRTLRRQAHTDRYGVCDWGDWGDRNARTDRSVLAFRYAARNYRPFDPLTFPSAVTVRRSASAARSRTTRPPGAARQASANPALRLRPGAPGRAGTAGEGT
jgi:hypothetical protein